MTWSPYDACQFAERLAFGHTEYNWFAIQARGRRGKHRRQFAILVWISRTGPRSILPYEDRPLFLVSLYDVEAATQVTSEIAFEHDELDPDTFSIDADGYRLTQSQPEGRFRAELAIESGESSNAFALELTLDAQKPAVTFGPDGSPNVAQGPIRTAYAHRSRLSAKGTLKFGDEPPWTLTGDACQDRQWLVVRPVLVKWIWLQLRLDDGRDLVAYVMRSTKSAWEPFDEGEVSAHEAWLIDRDGKLRALPRATIRSDTDTERTDAHGRCPTRVVLDAPELELTLTLEHVVPSPFIRLGAYGTMLEGGMWTGPARIVDAKPPLTGHAWLDVMNTAATTLKL